MGVAEDTVEALRASGHDAVHARARGLHTRPDTEILAAARAEGRTVVTFDLDFGDLLAAAGESLPSVVLVRTQDQRPTAVTPKVLDVFERFGADLPGTCQGS